MTGSGPPTQDVDKQFVQFVREQRLREAVEVIGHCFEDVPLEAGIGRLCAVVLGPWEWKIRFPVRKDASSKNIKNTMCGLSWVVCRYSQLAKLFMADKTQCGRSSGEVSAD